MRLPSGGGFFMVKFKTFSLTVCILLLMFLCIGLAAPAAALAVPVDNSSILTPPPGQEAEEEEEPQETIELTCQYPALKNPAGKIFEYEVQIAYKNGPRYAMMYGVPPVKCEKCGEESVFAAIKCEKCDKIFFPGTVEGKYEDKCPECGYSPTEEAEK